MKVAFAFHNGDIPQALDWFEWAAQLGGCPDHECLLVADAGVQWSVCVQMLNAANAVFRKTRAITTDSPVTGWPLACNKMFFTAAKALQGESFLWMEPDAIPLRKDWLKQIESAYSGKGFMGAIITGMMFGKETRYMNGVAVYPEDAYLRMQPFEDSQLAFDVAAAEVMQDHGNNSDLFHCHWGFKDKAPSFGETHDGQLNKLPLNFISEKAVIFHRNKDRTLIPKLREKLFPRIAVVLPFCWRDAQAMYANLVHMEKLHGQLKATAVVHFDTTAPSANVAPILTQAKRVFTEVYPSRYPEPKVIGWPWAPNVAFAAAARYMHTHLRIPWLWLEADAVPVKKDWLSKISQEYASCGKEFMGCHIEGIVHGIGHYNGVMVYPPDTALICQKGMRATNLAFDTEMAHEIHGRAFDSKLIQHHRGQPSFNSIADVQRNIGAETVLYHPCKDGSIFRFI